jgi:3-hydroxyacyl-[acyl-carrier-protein] dehydratase
MRWMWIDRIVELKPRERLVAIKNVSLAEEHLHEHLPGYPVMPNSLITEGLAQTGGLLVGECNAFEKKVVLAKIPKIEYFFPVVPGDTLTYTAELQDINEAGAIVHATSHVGDRLQAEAEIVFAHFEDGGSRALFDTKNFVFTLKLLGVFDVGRKTDGGRLIEPPGLVRLESQTRDAGGSTP